MQGSLPSSLALGNCAFGHRQERLSRFKTGIESAVKEMNHEMMFDLARILHVQESSCVSSEEVAKNCQALSRIAALVSHLISFYSRGYCFIVACNSTRSHITSLRIKAALSRWRFMSCLCGVSRSLASQLSAFSVTAYLNSLALSDAQK